MGQKVNPVGFRTGIMIGWKSRWYASKKEYSDLLIEDLKLRKHIKEKYRFAGIPKIEIERTRDGSEGHPVHCTSRHHHWPQGPRGRAVAGRVAGPGRTTHQHQDRRNCPAGNSEPQLVAEDIAEQLSKRASFRRTMKRAIEQSMEAGAKGIKVQLAGRLGMGPKWPVAKSKLPVRFRSRRCEQKSTTALRKRRLRKEISESKCGSIKACITRKRFMALMPKRVKHRKSQRGRIRGNATRGNRVVFGDFGLGSATQGGLASGALDDRSRAY